jgi:hypothetical protein
LDCFSLERRNTQSIDYAVSLDYPFERDAATDTLVQHIFGAAD